MNDKKKFHEGEKNKYYGTAKICVKVLRKQRDDMSLMKGFRWEHGGGFPMFIFDLNAVHTISIIFDSSLVFLMIVH